MTNPVQQQPGYSWNGVYSGIITTGAVSGTCTISSGSTTVSAITFNPQTSGPGGGSLRKGSLVVLGSGGHAPDIVATVVASASITLLTAASAGATGVAITAYNFPGLITGEAAATTSTNVISGNYYVGTQGNSGIVAQNDFNQAVYGDLVFIAGAAFTPSSGAYLQGWFLRSYDGGVTFEKLGSAVTAPARGADFIIPLYNNVAFAQGDRQYALDVNYPQEPFRVAVQNEAGVTMPATWGIWMLPGGIQLQT